MPGRFDCRGQTKQSNQQLYVLKFNASGAEKLSSFTVKFSTPVHSSEHHAHVGKRNAAKINPGALSSGNFPKTWLNWTLASANFRS